MYSGRRKDFPVKIRDRNKEIVLKNSEELVNLVDSKMSERLKITKSIGLKDILWELGISPEEEINAVQLGDARTDRLIESYLFYKNSPDKGYNNKVWWEAVKVMNSTMEKKIF